MTDLDSAFLARSWSLRHLNIGCQTLYMMWFKYLNIYQYLYHIYICKNKSSSIIYKVWMLIYTSTSKRGDLCIAWMLRNSFTLQYVARRERFYQLIRLMAQIRRSPVEVGSLFPLFTEFFTSQVVVWDFWTINRSNPKVIGQLLVNYYFCWDFVLRHMSVNFVSYFKPVHHKGPKWFGISFIFPTASSSLLMVSTTQHMIFEHFHLV